VIPLIIGAWQVFLDCIHTMLRSDEKGAESVKVITEHRSSDQLNG